MDMLKNSTYNIKLGESQERNNTAPTPTTQNDSQDSSRRDFRYCTFCQMDGYFADRCFKNPNGNRYNENYSKFNRPQNRDENCRSNVHLAPFCDIYPKAIIVAEPCQHCFKEYRQKFFHIESISMLVQRRKDQAEPGR